MDLEDQRGVDSQSVRELMQKYPNMHHCQASAKNKSKVKEVFERAALESLKGKQE